LDHGIGLFLHWRREARQRIEALEAQVDAWTRARDVAEQSIPVRQTAASLAAMRAEAAARELVRVEAPIDTLLKEAKATAADLAAKRAVLRAVQSALDPMSAEAKAIDSFLSPAPSDTFNGAAERHPAAAPWRMAFAALLDDPDTPLPG
jgi:hypothetical protein